MSATRKRPAILPRWARSAFAAIKDGTMSTPL
jgi:hypothetical protein